MKRISSSFHLGTLVLFGITAGEAAPIRWSPPVIPPLSLNLINEGAPVVARNLGDGASVTIDGQLFAGSPAGPGTGNTAGTSQGPGTGAHELGVMLDSHSHWTGGPGSRFSFELVDLTIGNVYQVQLWPAYDTRRGFASRRQRFGDGEIAEHFSDYLRRDRGGAVVGEFVADADFQRITVGSHPDFGNIDPGISGLFLRDLGPVKDADRDGIPDTLEDRNPPLDKFNPADASLDFDGDGLPNRDEILCGTGLLEVDTDADGLTDREEISGIRNPYRGGSRARVPGEPTDPLRADSDQDGLTDWEEVTGSRNGAFDHAPTDPNSSDTDGDDHPDGSETLLESSPLDPFSQPSQFL
ncbi:MAG: hypothetical protein GWO24_33330 [Akkermansiaceae bacterium]|nr:hypothetical protein [Akkermansiaceae bacterium]